MSTFAVPPNTAGELVHEKVADASAGFPAPSIATSLKFRVVEPPADCANPVGVVPKGVTVKEDVVTPLAPQRPGPMRVSRVSGWSPLPAAATPPAYRESSEPNTISPSARLTGLPSLSSSAHPIACHVPTNPSDDCTHVSIGAPVNSHSSSAMCPADEWMLMRGRGMIWYTDVASSAIASAGNTRPVAVFDVICVRWPSPVPAVICKSHPARPLVELPRYVTVAVGNAAALSVSVVVEPAVAAPVMSDGDAVRMPESLTAAAPKSSAIKSRPWNWSNWNCQSSILTVNPICSDDVESRSMRDPSERLPSKCTNPWFP